MWKVTSTKISDLINNIDHMLILGNAPSSVILSQTNSLKVEKWWIYSLPHWYWTKINNKYCLSYKITCACTFYVFYNLKDNTQLQQWTYQQNIMITLYVFYDTFTCNNATRRINRKDFFFVIINCTDTEYVMRINVQMVKHTRHTIVQFNLRYIIFNQNPGVIDVYLNGECLRRPPLELRSPWYFSLFRFCTVCYYVCWRKWRPCNLHQNITKKINWKTIYQPKIYSRHAYFLTL